MMFGAILSATDLVAVSALLNEVGAPPRLRIHISGESLLNDGSAIGAFSILYPAETSRRLVDGSPFLPFDSFLYDLLANLRV